MSEVLDEIEERGFKQGFEQGFEQGIEMGRLEMLYSLVHDGIIDVDEAAKRAGNTVKDFNAGMKKIYG